MTGNRPNVQQARIHSYTSGMKSPSPRPSFELPPFEPLSDFEPEPLELELEVGKEDFITNTIRGASAAAVVAVAGAGVVVVGVASETETTTEELGLSMDTFTSACACG